MGAKPKPAPSSIEAVQRQWSGYQRQVAGGRLKFSPQAALNAVRATNTALGWVLAVQQRLTHIKVADINALMSGIGLAGQFNAAAGNLDMALQAHGKILTQIAQTISAAGKAYPGVDQYSAGAFDGLKPELPHIGKTKTSIADRPNSDNPLKPWHNFQRHNWAPVNAKDTRPLDTQTVSAEPPASMSWSALHGLTTMNAAPIRDAGGEWRAMSANLQQAFADFATGISNVGGDWEGQGHTKLSTVVNTYVACTRTLTESMTLMGENLLYAAQWVDWTRTRMPPIPAPPTRSMNLGHVDSTVGITPTYGDYREFALGGDKSIRVIADGELYEGSPYNVAVALANHYRWNFWNWYVRGLHETTRNVPKIPLPANPGAGQPPGHRQPGTPPGDKPRAGGPGPRPDKPRLLGPHPAPRPDKPRLLGPHPAPRPDKPRLLGPHPAPRPDKPRLLGPHPAPRPDKPRLLGPHPAPRPDKPRLLGPHPAPQPKPTAPQRPKTPPPQAPQPGGQFLSAAQQALQAAHQLGQLPPASPDSVPTGHTADPPKAGLADPSKGGPGPGPGSASGGPTAQHPLLDRDAAQAKLFPRASLAGESAAALGRAGAMPVAGAPGAPGAAGAPAHGAGAGQEREHKRAEYLDSTEHLDEAMGVGPGVAVPVIEQ
ncbi:hypothetical protein [Nocardia brasiliensis]|uniref:WXG100 family type VII secretion target n=1 Tax=Nocardia brasiliensis TaxID=37326 RepID=UPI00366FD9C6